MTKNVKVITPVFRVSFPNVFQAKKNELSGKEEFSVVALFEIKNFSEDDKAKWNAINDKIKEMLLAKYGSLDKVPRKLEMPLKNGNEKFNDNPEKYLMYKDTMYTTFRTKIKPIVVPASLQGQLTDPKDFYAGCYARASVNISAWDFYEGKSLIKTGVSMYLNNLQKIKDGESFAGRSNPEDEFDAVEAAASSNENEVFDPMGGMGL